ncbi:MAG TPA: ATP-binding protein [Pyrinomonadaceae bacterium]|jgi:hypothetical protein
MKSAKEYPVVALNRFIEATRDSGYKNTASAVAELIDNSFEASASEIDVSIVELNVNGKRELKLAVSDNGCGMTPSVLRLALQFGGSTRFNSRDGIGRYGMGLPNSSLSQAQRVDVYSWTRAGVIWWSYLDIDEIALGVVTRVPKPIRAHSKIASNFSNSQSGTIVLWSKCDRLNHKRVKTIAAKLHAELGKLFRKQIYNGKIIRINGDLVQPVDPLFLNKGNNLAGATKYGPTINYEIQVPTFNGNGARHTSSVSVTFSELPIEKWHSLSNEEKRTHGISKNAGVSILRANREIDYGWFFMGAKRKENYDDWWRCEVQFDANLDELFGVTHTKQGIHPTEEITSILAPDIERIAHDLNSRVRARFLTIKSTEQQSGAQSLAASRDYLLEPPIKKLINLSNFDRYGLTTALAVSSKRAFPGLMYRIEHKVLREVSFFVPIIFDRELVVLLNEEHPFYERVYTPVAELLPSKGFRQALELMLFAAARAEYSAHGNIEKGWANSYRETWSNVLAAFLA